MKKTSCIHGLEASPSNLQMWYNLYQHPHSLSCRNGKADATSHLGWLEQKKKERKKNIKYRWSCREIGILFYC